MKCSRLAFGVTIYQTISGVALAILLLRLLVLHPDIVQREWPMWAAAPLISTGLIGSITVYASRHFKFHVNRKPLFILKIACFFLSSCCSVLCLMACCFAAVHFFRYLQQYIQCTEHLQDDYVECRCFYNTAGDHQRYYIYRGTSCQVVTNQLACYYVANAVITLLAAVASVVFQTILWNNRYSYFHAGRTKAEQVLEPDEYYTENSLSVSY